MMKKINSILVCLDLSSFDKALTNFTIYLENHLDADAKITLFHNIRYDFLGSQMKLSEEQIQTLKQKIKSEIHDQCKPSFKNENIDFDLIIDDDNSTIKSILKARDACDADLILMGKKRDDEGAGIVPQKLLSMDRKRTPMLLVREGRMPKIENFVAAVDLTPITAKLVDFTGDLAGQFGGTPTCLYVYQIPITYFPYIESSNKELKAEIKENSMEKFSSFIKENEDLKLVNWNLELRKGTNIARSIVEYLEESDGDLLVIARVGKPNLLGTRVGGVTRSLLNLALPVPLLII
ncbi:MAG TPA: universal stress protein [Saprospiraceae bacterium]|nr:universal stress protein [Saprospiraceae bacterium]